MVQANDVHAADPAAVLAFLKATRPFSDLDEDVLTELCEQFRIDFFPKGTLIFEQDASAVNDLHLISRGAVKVFLTDEDKVVTLKDFRGEGGYFGALAIIRGSRANLNVETVEDTFCYLLPKDLFLDLIQTYPGFAHYYLKRFSEEVVTVAYSELRNQKVKPRAQDGLYLFTTHVGEVVKRQLEVIPSSETVQQAAAKMSQLRIGSLLIHNQSGEIVGIATDNDLRTKVVAKGLGYSLPVAEIMTRPVQRIGASATCFDALLQMMNQQVHHLAVENMQGTIMGMVTAHDIMVHQGTSPISLFREILAQRKIDGLYSLAEKVPLVIRTLVAEGAKANNITRMIAVLNDQIVNRVLMLLEEELGPAPFPYCWLMLGSEGRQEQTFKTDQDNALIYETPPEEWEAIKQAKLYFRRFGNLAIEHLAKCGYPLCKGQMMASNPKWRKPFSTWHNYFDRWMSAPEPQAVLHATIFFDFRAGYGDTSLADRLRDFLVREAPQRSIFLVHLAKDCLVNRPPLSFFRNFIVEKDGEHKNRLDIKTRGLVPYVDFGRLMALKHGIKETNTIARLQALGDGDFIPRDLFVESREAYEYQMQLRLVHQLQMMEADKTPDNYIDPAELSDLEKQTLKEAFAIISKLQGYIKAEMRVTEAD